MFAEISINFWKY